MILKSFSKINLSLNVTKKLVNGMHDIQSYFCLVNLFDTIKINKNNFQKDEINLEGKFAKHVDRKKNSVLATLRLLRKKKQILNYYSVTLIKNIPVFAGLGGGTSNAAYLLKYFFKKKKNKKLLNLLSNKIGSDTRLFFYNQGFLKNLNNVESLKTKCSLNFLLVYPNIKSSTRYVYSKVSRFSSRSKFPLRKLDTKKKFVKFLMTKNNDLQTIVEKKHPIIKKLLVEIAEIKGCYFSRMTGSGSVCYGVFQSEKSAKSALYKIKRKFPKFWSHLAKTI